MLSALKQEILNKKRLLEEQKIVSQDKKFFKRSELEEIENRQSASEALNAKSAKDESNVNTQATTSKQEEVDDTPILPRVEVIRRLREREEPVLLFGERECDAFRRLRRLEILEPEINRGFRNDFQEALEKVDKAYLNEILHSTKQSAGDDVSVLVEEEHTLEGVQELAKAIINGGSYELKCKVIFDFIQLVLQIWGNRLNSRKEAQKMSVRGKMDSATFSQTNCYLKPLTKRLKKKNLPEDILEYLKDIVMFCLERDYVKANDVYLQMAIGNAPWPIGVTMVGIHERTGREKIFSKHVAHVLNDETQRKYIQGIKRLITKCQSFFLAAPSKCVEYQALDQV